MILLSLNVSLIHFAPNNAEKVIQEKAYKVVSSCKDGAVSEAIEYALENL